MLALSPSTADADTEGMCGLDETVESEVRGAAWSGLSGGAGASASSSVVPMDAMGVVEADVVVMVLVGEAVGRS